ncbi:MAG: hypothetical protein ACRD3W_00425, partial [Terriglobales bacterium]
MRTKRIEAFFLSFTVALNVVAGWTICAAYCPGASADDSAVKQERDQIDEQLRNLGETLERIRRVSGELHHEVNRYEMINSGPDLV